MPKILLVGVIIIAILGLFYFTESKNPPQANWKTYSNTDFGITLSYPADLYTPNLTKTFPSPINPKVFTDDLKTVPIISLESIKPEGPDDSEPVSIEKFTNTTIETWLKANSEAEKTEIGSYFPVSNQNIKKAAFAGSPALLLTQKTNPQVSQELYLVQVGNDVFYISYLSDFPVTDNQAYKDYNTNFDKETKPDVEKILASIKFI